MISKLRVIDITGLRKTLHNASNSAVSISTTLETGQQFLFDPEPVIKGFPELRWTGKRPYRSTQYYPAQLRESYGDPSVDPDGKPWMNKIYWGDNLQVMSHLLKDYRGKVDLIYIDPPFDSKADYKKKIRLIPVTRGGETHVMVGLRVDKVLLVQKGKKDEVDATIVIDKDANLSNSVFVFHSFM